MNGYVYRFIRTHQWRKIFWSSIEYKYQEDLTKPEGTIIKQSRAKDTIVTPGATLVITVTTKPEEADPDNEVVVEE